MTQTLEIKRSSAAMWGSATGVRSLPNVSKYIDTSTCTGCKACEVACLEWNDLQHLPTKQIGSYQTRPKTDPRQWNMIRFAERQNDAGEFVWLMRKDQCLHCSDPGCLAACPAPGAIVQYQNGVVDVDPSKCIGCGYCASGCPFDIPRFDPVTKKMSKCTLCVDRVSAGLEPACVKACPTGCLAFGPKEQMLSMGKKRVDQLKANGYMDAALYDPKGVDGTSVVTVLKYGNHPDWYGLPGEPRVPLFVTAWKSVLRPLGVLVAGVAFFGTFMHYTKYGPKEPSQKDIDETMKESAEKPEERS